MGIILDEDRKGFTIIEVMLFLALSGFLLAGIMVGTGSSIANQRYKDAVQDALDVLRNAYSFVADTQVQERSAGESACNGTDSLAAKNSDAETGRGRTSCAVYGAVVSINANSIQTTTLIGYDYYDVFHAMDNGFDANSSIFSEADYNTLISDGSTDLNILKALHANNIVASCNATGANCTWGLVGNHSSQKLKWGALFKKRNTGNVADNNSDLALTLLIFRSPRNGSIRTLVWEGNIEENGKPIDYDNINTTNYEDIGIAKYLDNFEQKEIFFCIASDGTESYAGHNRIIRIVRNSYTQTGIVLEDMDADVRDEHNKVVSCDK